MELNDLLNRESVDPAAVIVLRHRPKEPKLNNILPWLAGEQPDVFNAYQQTQGQKLAEAFLKLQGKGYVASFIRHGGGRALFVGLYAITSSRMLNYKEFWEVPAYQQMKSYGMKGWAADETTYQQVRWFDLGLTDFYAEWKGKMIIDWPPPEISWWRRAHTNTIRVAAVLEESAFTAEPPDWHEIDLSWEELAIIPTRWKNSLREWRAIYYIRDASDGKGYVGSASGEYQLLGRWLNYADKGHGGNVLLRRRDPRNFRFTILERLSPDATQEEVVRLESSWKKRLHTHAPEGLNDN